MEEGCSLGTKTKRFSMTESLKEREEVIAFLEAGRPMARNEIHVNRPSSSPKTHEDP